MLPCEAGVEEWHHSTAALSRLPHHSANNLSGSACVMLLVIYLPPCLSLPTITAIII